MRTFIVFEHKTFYEVAVHVYDGKPWHIAYSPLFTIKESGPNFLFSLSCIQDLAQNYNLALQHMSVRGFLEPTLILLCIVFPHLPCFTDETMEYFVEPVEHCYLVVSNRRLRLPICLPLGNLTAGGGETATSAFKWSWIMRLKSATNLFWGDIIHWLSG